MKRLLCFLIRGYQAILSPVFHVLGGPGSGCRFHPTCSAYMIEAIQTHGSLKGLWLGFRRLGKCHPWGPSGPDPVPPVRTQPPS
jgi:uncharacterized protein